MDVRFEPGRGCTVTKGFLRLLVAPVQVVLRVTFGGSHFPYENTTAARVMVSAIKIPDSPIHSSAPVPLLAGSNAVWMMAFQAECSAIAGQT